MFEYERIFREMSGAGDVDKLVEWYSKVTRKMPESFITRIQRLNERLSKYEDELDSAYGIIKTHKDDKNVAPAKLSQYVHYWYVQEFKFNRMLEEKTTITTILSYLLRLESEDFVSFRPDRNKVQDALVNSDLDLELPSFNRKTFLFYQFHDSEPAMKHPSTFDGTLHCQSVGFINADVSTSYFYKYRPCLKRKHHKESMEIEVKKHRFVQNIRDDEDRIERTSTIHDGSAARSALLKND